MKDLVLDYQRTERRIQGKHFYPVHLTNSELNQILLEAFAEAIAFSSSTTRVSVRTDRGDKGIDFRLEETLKKPHQVVRQRMLTFGLNANWEVEGFFEHYTQPAGAAKKTVAGKDYLYPRYVAQQHVGYTLQEPDAIFVKRLVNPAPPERNPLFNVEGWTCLYEHDRHLDTLDIVSQ